MFAHMLIERGQSWFTELLRLSLLESRDLQINPRNCIGTVLALNGHRKYFCMYHAKHPETIRGTKVCTNFNRFPFGAASKVTFSNHFYFFFSFFFLVATH